MIGDSNGNTSYECEISLDNPYIERYVSLLNSLKPTSGTWGIILDPERLHNHFKEGQINKEEYSFLNTLMWDSFDDGEDENDEEFIFDIPDENLDYSLEFYEGVRDELDCCSFLVFEGVDLLYIDENGNSHNTEIKNG